MSGLLIQIIASVISGVILIIFEYWYNHKDK
ncbi:type I toxin-antitoxin system Fst family toxin [Lactococcus taiwanensis]